MLNFYAYNVYVALGEETYLAMGLCIVFIREDERNKINFS